MANGSADLSWRARGRRLGAFVVAGWRRSILTRVIVGIALLSSLVIGTVGWLVFHQISDGLVGSKVKSSLTEASSETDTARGQLTKAGSTDFDPDTQLRLLTTSLITRGNARGFDVLMRGPLGNAHQVPGVSQTTGLDAASVPTSLSSRVERDDVTAWTYAKVRRTDRPAYSGVVVGSTLVTPSDGSTYAVYYLFPMQQEDRTLVLARRALLTSGVLLVALIVAVAWLVTRQVLNPIRMARRVAERIASGRLEERMAVVGADDIARLATSFNQMANTLQQQIRQLVELSRVQRTFVSDVSHELRTPLTTVRMAGEVLFDARPDFDPVTARAAELLHNELDRFETLLTDLLEISRFDAGAAGLELEKVDVVEVAQRVADGAAPLAAGRGVRVEVQGDREAIAEVDVRRIERVVRNLVTNAIDHADPSAPGPGSLVEVTVHADEHAVALVVRDHGVGLEPGQQAMVFNRFWRADPARARTTGGTGLGLAIALEDARLHGGWLQAWGAPGRGASFRLTMPRRAGDPITHSPLPLVPADVRAISGGVG